MKVIVTKPSLSATLSAFRFFRRNSWLVVFGHGFWFAVIPGITTNQKLRNTELSILTTTH